MRLHSILLSLNWIKWKLIHCLRNLQNMSFLNIDKLQILQMLRLVFLLMLICQCRWLLLLNSHSRCKCLTNLCNKWLLPRGTRWLQWCSRCLRELSRLVLRVAFRDCRMRRSINSYNPLMHPPLLLCIDNPSTRRGSRCISHNLSLEDKYQLLCIWLKQCQLVALQE
jgi:hypothetical protein